MNRRCGTHAFCASEKSSAGDGDGTSAVSDDVLARYDLGADTVAVCDQCLRARGDAGECKSAPLAHVDVRRVPVVNNTIPLKKPALDSMHASFNCVFLPYD